MPPERLLLAELATPLGTALLVTDENGLLRALDFAGYEARMLRLLRLHYGPLAPQPGAAPAAINEALADYFAGQMAALRRIGWATAGTAFQRAVWAALVEIPAGSTLTYGALARQLGRPAAVRAVGAANGANPLSIVVPCHRLVGADGSLTGYAGGLPRKQWLLAHEAAAARAA